MIPGFGERILDFAFMRIACFPLHVTENAPRPWRLVATFLWFPWWIFITAPIWIPLELLGLLLDIWETT